MTSLAEPLTVDVAELVRILSLLIRPARGDAGWHQHWTARRWVAVERLRAALKLDRVAMAGVVAAAEAAGYIRCDVGPMGDDRLGLEKLAVGVFGLAGGKRRRVPDPDTLAGIDHADLLAVVASFESTAPPVESVARSLGRDVETVWDEIRAAEGSGLVETWADHPVAPTVSLSPYVAGRLGLVPADDGSIWLTDPNFDPTRALDRAVIASETDCSDPDSAGVIATMSDPNSPEGWDALAIDERAGSIWSQIQAENAEADEAASCLAHLQASGQFNRMPFAERELLKGDAVRPDAAEIREKLPRPQTLLAVRAIWPVMVAVDGNPRRWSVALGECPECAGKRFNLTTYCLLCDRSGVDRILLPVAPEMIPVPARSAAMPSSSRVTRRRSARQGKVKEANAVRTLKGGLG